MIQVELQDRVLSVRFDRAQRKNAITAAMYEQLAEAFGRAHSEAEVRVVLLQGSDTCFTAGNDLEDFAAQRPRSEEMPVLRFLRAISTCPKPVVAAVAGPAVGIGTTMLLHCDLIDAADTARLSMPFVPLGLCPEAASSLLLPQSLGWARAASLLLLGESIDAQTALAYGLVNRVVPAAELLTGARERALRLAALPAAAVRETKRLMKLGQSDPIQSRMTEEFRSFGERLKSAEAQEAFAAFAAKRAPDFSRFD